MPKQEPPFEISFTPVFKEDPKGRGYSGYLAEFPDLFAQGETREEVVENLLLSLNDILTYNKEASLFQIPEEERQNTSSIKMVQAL